MASHRRHPPRSLAHHVPKGAKLPPSLRAQPQSAAQSSPSDREKPCPRPSQAGHEAHWPLFVPLQPLAKAWPLSLRYSVVRSHQRLRSAGLLPRPDPDSEHRAPKTRCHSVGVPGTDVRPYLKTTRDFLRRDLLEELPRVPTITVSWFDGFDRKRPESPSAEDYAHDGNRRSRQNGRQSHPPHSCFVPPYCSHAIGQVWLLLQIPRPSPVSTTRRGGSRGRLLRPLEGVH